MLSRLRLQVGPSWRGGEGHGGQSKRKYFVAVLAVVALAAMTTLLFWSQGPDYVLVIDGGSSGTRIYAYKWKDNGLKLPTLTAVDIHVARHKIPRRAAGDKRAYERLETEPGLDKFVADPDGLQTKALGPLLEWAEAVVPRKQWDRTPIFLFGTAGLRKLPHEAQQSLLIDLQDALSRSQFRFEPAYASIISGEDEGMFGWIAVNYLQGYLAPSAPPAPVIVQGKPAAARGEAASDESATAAGNAVDMGLKTVGTLDLGGSSLEVTFMPTSAPLQHATANVTIMGVQYPLFTHAHHGYGLNDAFDRSIAILVESNGEAPTPENIRRSQNKHQALQQHVRDRQHETEQGVTPHNPDVMRTLQPSRVHRVSSHEAPRSRGLRQTLGHESARHVSNASSKVDTGLKWGVGSILGDTQLAAEGGEHHSIAMKQLQAFSEAGADSQGLAALDSAKSIAAAADVLSMAELTPASDAVPAPELITGSALVAERQLRADLPVVAHPCLHNGYGQPYRRSIVDGELPKPATVQLVGRPDYEACAALAELTLNSSDCGAAHCVLGAPQPATGDDFIALAGFFVVYHFFGLPPTATLAELEREGRRHCAVDWEPLHAARGAEIQMDQYCFRVPYIMSLLQEGLSIPEEKLRVGSGREGWTLGAALAEGGRIGIGRPILKQGAWDVAALARFLAIAALVLCLLGLVIACVTREPMLALPLRHRTHSIESNPDDLLSPKTQSLETKAATLLQTPAHNLFAPLPSALSLPLRGVNGGQQPAFAPVNISAFRGISNSRKRQPSVDNLKALADS